MAETKMQLVDWLDDLCVRFIINLPREELESVERICFQVEEAQWFYEDFVRPLDPSLPSLSLRQFCLKIFQHCPLFSGYDTALHSHAFSEFLAYKTRVPVRGAILLNDAMTEVVLVKGWKKGANWSFPRGKINKDEKDIDCAIREVYEETGYDVRAAGLVNEDDAKHIEVTMREQHMKLFIFAGVPMDTYFEPRTRKEISKIQWYKLSELPTSKKIKQQQQQDAPNGEHLANKFYMVAPFLGPLKKIITQLRKAGTSNLARRPTDLAPQQSLEGLTQRPDHQETGHQDTIGGLVAMLRESKQATESQRQPSTPLSVLSEEQASACLKDLLKVSEDPPEQEAALIARKNLAAVKDSKAQAMMSLIRSGSDHLPATSARQQSPSHLRCRSKPDLTSVPSLPVQHQSPLQSTPMTQPNPRAGNVQGNRGTLGPFPSRPAYGIYVGNSSQSERPPVFPLSDRPLAPTAPYHLTGDFSLSHGPQSSQADISTNAPAPRKIPLPKLNAHSSALLSLFKSSPSSSLSAPGHGSQTAASNSISRPELSANVGSRTREASPQTLNHLSLPPITRPVDGGRSEGAGPAHGPQGKWTSHQETLLGLFKAPAASRRSPSLNPPLPPVELSAAPAAAEGTRVDGDGQSGLRMLNAGFPAPGQIRIAKRPAVPESAAPPDGRAQHSKSASREAPKPVKILARPESRGNIGGESHPLPASSSQQPQSNKSRQNPFDPGRDPAKASPARPFHPKILKRPTPGNVLPLSPLGHEPAHSSVESGVDARQTARSSAHETARPPSLANSAVSILSHPGNSVDRSPSTLSGDLDGFKSPTVSSMPLKQGVRGAMSGDLSRRKHRAPASTAPPLDQDFLLGYLSQVAREGK